MRSDASSRPSPGAIARPYSQQSAVRSRRRQMTARPRATNAWWMSSRISQRIRRRRKQCSSAIAPSTTQLYTPGPKPCPVPRRAMCGGDLEPADLVPVDLVVIAAIGVQVLGAAQWPATLTADRRDGLDQRDQLVTSLRLPPSSVYPLSVGLHPRTLWPFATAERCGCPTSLMSTRNVSEKAPELGRPPTTHPVGRPISTTHGDWCTSTAHGTSACHRLPAHRARIRRTAWRGCTRGRLGRRSCCAP